MDRLETNDPKQIKPKKKQRIYLVIIAFFAILFIAVISSFISYKYITKNLNMQGQQANFTIPQGEQIEVKIPRGSGTAGIAKILKKEGFIKFPYVFKLLSRFNGYDGSYQAGTHVLSKKLGYTDLMRVLVSKPIKGPDIEVTIPEGFNLKQTIELLKEKNLINVDKFNDALENGSFEYKFIKDIPYRERKLEGYLFPETYEFQPDSGELAVINRLLKQFDTEFTDEMVARAKELKMTIDQIVILASIIEREAKVSSERPIISGVFYNRLKSKDPALRKLQSCATIQYIYYYKDGVMKEAISDEDTKVVNPYNTYIRKGLPPGPICSPGKESLLAALNPEQTDYYYFVAKDDGSGEHYFSKTYDEHLKNQSIAKANKEKNK